MQGSRLCLAGCIPIMMIMRMTMMVWWWGGGPVAVGLSSPGKTLFSIRQGYLVRRVVSSGVCRTDQPVGCESYVSISRPTACMHVKGRGFGTGVAFFQADQNVPESQIGFFASHKSPILGPGRTFQDKTESQQPHQLRTNKTRVSFPRAGAG